MKRLLRYSKRLSMAFLAVLCVPVAVLALVQTPAYAIAQPDSPLQINSVYVFEFSDGSIGVLGDYYIDYASLPTETATESMLAIFIDSDGTTQLKSVAPYTFVNSGYGRGQFWIKFTPAEVVSYGLTSADQALYRVWLMGNPTLSWDGGAPPSVSVTIDQWNTTGDMSVLLALRVLYYADQDELAWSVDMVEPVTGLGNRLTTTGASYFLNVIPNLDELAPACLASATVYPDQEILDYTADFSVIVTSNTSTVTGSPVSFTTDGVHTFTTTSTGNISIAVGLGTDASIVDWTGTITGNPDVLAAGDNNLTVTGAGTFNITMSRLGVQGQVDRNIAGTGFDLTAAAAAFGMSRLMFSGIIWILLTIVVAVGVYGTNHGPGSSVTTNGTIVTFVSSIFMMVGWIFGMVDGRIIGLLGVLDGAVITYYLFFRNGTGDLSRTFTAAVFMWFIITLMGGIQIGVNPQTVTVLTAATTNSSTELHVLSTDGFAPSGAIEIEDERIYYYDTDNTTFSDTYWRSMVRGANDTEAAAHPSGSVVRSVENSLMNGSIDFALAQLADTSGTMFFVTLPIVFWELLKSLAQMPFAWLGNEFAILGYVWLIVLLGLIFGIFIALAGGRRMS